MQDSKRKNYCIKIMLKKTILSIGLFFLFTTIHAQTDTIGKIRYSKDFKFKDGVYVSFEDFKNNRPSFSIFRIKNTNKSSGNIGIEVACDNPENGKWCSIDKIWGYCSKGNVYIYQGYASYYFRLQIIGALIHYIGFEGFNYNHYDRNFAYYDYYMPTTAVPKFSEFFLDFDTGESYVFSYRIFRDFLKAKDEELYEELMNTKKKRKVYTHFLMKYNKKHPIYFNKE